MYGVGFYQTLLKDEPLWAVLPASVTLKAANGAVMDMLGFMHFDLQLVMLPGRSKR